MNMKRFRLICKFMSYMLTFLVAVCLVITVMLLSLVFADPGNNISAFIDLSNRTFLQFGTGHYSDADLELTATILIPIITMTYAYIFRKASSLFDYLADGDTPFSSYFSRSVKTVSIVMIVNDIMIPLLHSLVLSIVMGQGYSFSFGLSDFFFFGLIFYVAAEVLNYGIELQQLSDETV